MAGTLLTMLMPSSVFLDDDIDSLLGERRQGANDDWLGILLVPEPTWSMAEIALAVRNVQKRAHAAAVLIPSLNLETLLETLARRCPEGGTIVMAWPGAADEGLAHLRRVRGAGRGLPASAAASASADESPIHAARAAV